MSNQILKNVFWQQIKKQNENESSGLKHVNLFEHKWLPRQIRKRLRKILTFPKELRKKLLQ